MSAKHQPAGAFGRKLGKAPDDTTHPLAPKAGPVSPLAPKAEGKRTQFSARMDADLLKRVKIAAVTEGVTLQDAADQAFELWLADVKRRSERDSK